MMIYRSAFEFCNIINKEHNSNFYFVYNFLFYFILFYFVK